MVFEADKVVVSGPEWIFGSIKFVHDTKEGVFRVTSTALANKALKVHYCKLLSPARALEWLLVGSLRKNYNISLQ